MNQLMRIVLDPLCFFELSSDEILDQDAAVRQIESIGSDLDKLSADEKRAFLACAEAMATEETQRPKRAAFLRSMATVMGWEHLAPPAA